MAVVKFILALALVGGLFIAGWNVYRRLPSDEAGAPRGTGAETEVIVKYEAPELNGKGNDVVIDAYPIDLESAQREFLNRPYQDKRFEDFLAKRMREKTPVRARLDENGHAVVKLASGSWLIHAVAALPGSESIEWRLPISVNGSQQTIELTAQNVWERTKKF
ncbi:MAG TPA: hypothetical protein VHD88_08635 [Pyrinomonadaceae bacterium]|nr:hypothetical protein [Pyrinomonadaceae bacterium]